jgi:alkylhydroperoxidase family enzyme
VRFAVARQQGLTEERVALIDDGFETSALSAREKATIRLVDTMLRGETPSEAQRRELAEHFDDGQLVELTTAIALFLGFSKIAVALGPPPDMPVQVIPTPGWPVGEPAAPS